MTQVMSRRQCLGLVAGALGTGVMLSACQAPSNTAPRSSVTGARPSAVPSSSPRRQPLQLAVDKYGPATLPDAQAAFAKSYPEITLDLVSFLPHAPKSPWIYTTTAQVLTGSPYSFVPLDSALRALNFDRGLLLPDTVDPYVRAKQTIGLPFTEIPWGVLWNAAAFSAAGIKEPTPDWTIADFQDACAALKSLGSSGVHKGLVGALAPLVTDVPPNARDRFMGSLTLPGLWEAFAWGYGGKIVQNGRYTLTDPGTTRGIATLVELGRQYAVSQAAALAHGYGVGFALYHPGRLSPGWRWARLPRFPVDPVITTVSVAQLLVGSPTATSSDTVTAATEYLLWWYSSAATQILTAQATPPALASPEVQAQYWRGRSSDASGLGDYANFRDCYSGLPTVPDEGIQHAVDQVLAGTAGLADALATLQKNLNNAAYVPRASNIAEPAFRAIPSG